MTTAMSIRDALLEVRRFVSEDQERATRVQTLLTELNEAVNERVSATNKVVENLSVLVNGVSAVLGFSADLDSVLVETEKKPQRPTKKQKTSPVVQLANAETVPVSVIDPKTEFSDIEKRVLEVLKARHPKFTNPKQLVKEGALDATGVASPTITRLRKKNVPIESAKQARENDPNIRQNTTGWRLIED